MHQASNCRQAKYARDLLERFHMTDCKSAPTPFLSRVKIEDGEKTPLVDITLYRQLVGRFLYLTHSRTNLSYAFDVVSRFMQEPHELHWKVAKCIFRYVQGTITFGIHYVADSTLDLMGLLILTGLAIALIAIPHLVTHSVLVPGLYVGQARRQPPLLYLQLRKSTEG
jgi:hypothetical protein